MTHAVHLNGKASQRPRTNLLQQTVQQFLDSINWDDQPPEVQQFRLTAQDASQPLSLSLTVNQFFGAIQWEGQAAPSSPSRPITPESNDTLTLDDFSDLF